mgnify:CR=1 FL=1
MIVLSSFAFGTSREVSIKEINKCIATLGRVGVSLGVILETTRDALDEVTDSDVPLLIKTFNTVYPEKTISNEVVDESISVARQSNKVNPLLK